MDVNYASNAKGNLGVTLGAVGTGLALADGGANLIGKLLGGGTVGGSSDPGDKPVTRYEAGLMQQTTDAKIEIAQLRGRFNRLTDEFVPNEHVAPGWGFAAVQPAPPPPPYPYPPYLYPPFVPAPIVPPVVEQVEVQTTSAKK